VSSSRDRILDSARDAFADRGLIGASIGDVSAAATASVGSIYHHFDGKEGLAGAVYVAALGDFQRAFAAAVTREPEAEPGIRAGVHTVLRWCLRDEPAGARFQLTAADAARGAAAAELGELNREFFAAVLAWWRPHVRSGTLRDLDLDLAHAIWLGPALEHCRHRLDGRARVSARRADRELADAAWNALRRQGDDTP
jgi:AcrR family transcriptional regulator